MTLEQAARIVLQSAGYESGKAEPPLHQLNVSITALDALRSALNDAPKTCESCHHLMVQHSQYGCKVGRCYCKHNSQSDDMNARDAVDRILNIVDPNNILHQ